MRVEIVMQYMRSCLEVPEGVSSVEEICRIMAIAPDWATGLPLRADGYECLFYKKD
jgi:DNA polymerase